MCFNGVSAWEWNFCVITNREISLPAMPETQVPSLGREEGTSHPWRREWQPTPVFLPGEWTEEPGGLHSS